MQKHDNKMTGIVEPDEFHWHDRVMMRRQMDSSGGGSAVESMRFRDMLEYTRKSGLICGHQTD